MGMVIYWDVLVECLAYSHRSKRSWKSRAEQVLGKKTRSSPAEIEKLAAEMFAAFSCPMAPTPSLKAKLWLRLGYARNIERALPRIHLIGSDLAAVAARFVQHSAG